MRWEFSPVAIFLHSCAAKLPLMLAVEVDFSSTYSFHSAGRLKVACSFLQLIFS
ncbi:hypothetical protein M758_6G191900 [Ceratodon purpureus]|uniref:Uncharacterized protein n=1 Tax=Ceratodon purpureus TaxID=3225 RepID=A0A8T0HJK1_CERPU|nr:hypothetical protein KC19_6G200600 [Ceratodon purpureus]KAG0614629.1 hypothetical protein M758_6G191900 [Ceratodon purpureus]